MTLNNAIKIGKAIERYNLYFNKEQELDFYEVVSLMDNPSDNKEVENIIKEINNRIATYQKITDIYLRGIIKYNEYNLITKAL